MSKDLRPLDPKVIDGEVIFSRPVQPQTASPKGGSRLLGAVSVLLLVVTAVLGTMFVQERSAHDEDRRHLRTQTTRQAQRAAALAAELAVVRAQRDRLVRAEAQALTPAAAAAIRACVQRYAELERTLAGGAGTPVGVQPTCINAEPYVR